MVGEVCSILPSFFSTTETASVVGLFVGCLTSQQHASVSQGRICSDNFTCCHTEVEVAVLLLLILLMFHHHNLFTRGVMVNTSVPAVSVGARVRVSVGA